MGEAFIQAMHDDFERWGPATIELARMEDPLGYVKVVANLLPKELTGVDGGAIVQRIERVIVDPANPDGPRLPPAALPKPV